MSQAYEDMLRQGRELRALRSRNTEPDSPCARCRRDACPQTCFPRKDYERRHRK